jgi:outer membrane protein assembly factor BamA
MFYGSLCLALAGPMQAQSQASTKPEEIAPGENQPSGWIFAPIPINSPAVGAGLEFAVARLFRADKSDKVSPPSALAVGGLITSNGSRALAFGGRLYLKEDKYRLTAGVGTADVNADIYGVNGEGGKRGTYIPMNGSGTGVMVEPLFRLRKGVYLGMRTQYRNLTLSLNKEQLEEPDFKPQPPDQVAQVIGELQDHFTGQQTVSIGPRFEWDTRDNVFYPSRGLFMDVWSDFFTTGLGSKWNYQYYKVGFNKYMKLDEHQVLAFRAMGCAAAGDFVPIYDLCLFGVMNDLRGYAAGQFQDRRMFATQAEYRMMLPVEGFAQRLGFVVFGGVGGVDKKFSDIEWEELLPAGGAGIRFRLTKKYPVNFRVDYAFGRYGNTLSIGVLEAF